MSRYIDVDAIVIRARDGYDMDGVLYLPYRDVKRSLDSAPSINIVRCGECRHYYNKDPQQIPTANIMCSHMHPDDFCSYGEREEQ